MPWKDFNVRDRRRKSPLWYSKAVIDAQLRENLARTLHGVDSPNSRVIASAFWVANYFLGPDFVERFLNSACTDKFYLLVDKEGDEYLAAIDRLCWLADYLYVLSDTEGFDRLLARIKHREKGAPFFEGMIAYFHRLAGQNIVVHKETGNKGSEPPRDCRRLVGLS